MTKHYNPSIVERANRILASKAGDYLSDEVIPNIQPVIPITAVARICQGTAGTAATNTIYTTPADKDFYLTGAVLAYIKDVTSTATLFRYRVFVNELQKEIITLPAITLTPGCESVAIELNPPLKLDRNTTVVCTTDSTVANVKVSGNVIGYTEEVTR